MGHFGGQATLQVDVPVNHGEILLLELDGLVRCLVQRRQGVGRIDCISSETVQLNVAETYVALVANETDGAVSKPHIPILWKPPRILRFGIANHIDSFYLHGNVLSTDSNLERSPLAVIFQCMVEVADMKERTALDRTVYRSSMDQNLIAASRSIIMEGDFGRILDPVMAADSALRFECLK